MRAALVLAALIGVAPVIVWAEDAPDALAQLEQGTVSSGTALTPAAIADSQDAGERLTYASLLFYRDLASLRDSAPSAALFQEVEQELQMVIRLSAADANERRRNLLRSQAAYMLGDVWRYVKKDPAKAKAFYRQAVRYVPEHTAANEALKRLP